MHSRLLAMGSLSIAAAAGASPAAAAGCNSLHGHPVINSTAAKVVTRSVTGGKRFLGCAKPSGHVRVLGFDGSREDVQSGFDVVRGAGTYLVTTSSFDEGAGGRQHDSRDLVNLATGESRNLYSIEYAEGDCPGINHEPVPHGFPRRIVLGANGIAVVAFVGTDDPNCSEQGTKIVAFVPGRAEKRLDGAANGVIPPSSLKLRGRIARWTHGSRARSATL